MNCLSQIIGYEYIEMSGTRKKIVNVYSKDPNLETKKQKAREKALQKQYEIRKEAWKRVTPESVSTDEKGAIETYGLPRKRIQELYKSFGNTEKLNAHLKSKLEYLNPDIKGLEDNDSVNFGSPIPAELSASPLPKPKTRKNWFPRTSQSSRSSSAPSPQNKTRRRKHNRPVIKISNSSRSSSSSSSRSSSRNNKEPEKIFVKRRNPKSSFADVRHSGHEKKRAHIVKKIRESQSV
jgi:hypothetical protein